MEDLIFIEAKEVRTEYIDGINNLLGQLTSSPKEMNEALLQAIVESDRTHLFLAYIGNQMVGMATLAAYIIPTGTKSLGGRCCRGQQLQRQAHWQEACQPCGRIY